MFSILQGMFITAIMKCNHEVQTPVTNTGIVWCCMCGAISVDQHWTRASWIKTVERHAD